MSKKLWVLPDVDQQGKLWVVDSLTNKKFSLIDFYKQYDIKTIAREFEIGIPEELLNKFQSENYAFAQIIKNHMEIILSISIRCGKDIDGRTVTLTYVQVEKSLEKLTLPNQEDIEFIRKSGFNFNIDSDCKSKLEKMKDAVLKYSEKMSFSSDKLEKNLYKHNWNGEDPPSTKKWVWLGGAIVCLILLSLIFK